MTAMFSTFLLLRTVFFALLLMFAFLSVLISIWNITSISSSGQLLSTPSTIMITSNCLLLFCIGSSIIGYLKPEISSTRIMVECGWTAIMSLSQLVAAISMTTNGLSLNCNPIGDWNVCASTLVLVPVSWLNSLITFTYFIGLFLTVMAHQRVYPDIWTRTIYAVDWFVDPRMEVFLSQAILPLQFDACFGKPGIATFNAQQEHLPAAKGTLDIEKAPWAENVNVRRGKDNPYVASGNQSYRNGRPTPVSIIPKNHRMAKTVSASTDRTLLSTHLSGGSPLTNKASLPPRPSHSVTSTGSRYVEGLNQNSKTWLPVSPQIWDGTSPFPSTVHDHDLPIPLPKRSEWIRAGKF